MQNENSVFSLDLQEAIITPNNYSNNALALLGISLDVTESIGGGIEYFKRSLFIW